MAGLRAVSRIHDFLKARGAAGKCNPTVARYWHLLTGGFVWFAVGNALILVACSWLSETQWPLNLFLALGSMGIGFVIHFYLVSRIALRNILRIQTLPEVTCLFAFQAPRSYFLVIFMMLLGFILRHLPIPKYITAPIYIMMGSALAFSSSLYFQAFRND